MNKFEKLAEILGIEIGEEFRFKGSDTKYKIKEFGVWSKQEGCINYIHSAISANSLLSKEIIKLPWKPKDGEAYYFLAPDSLLGYYRDRCCLADYEKALFERTEVYKTEEEVVEKVKELGWRVY